MRRLFCALILSLGASALAKDNSKDKDPGCDQIDQSKKDVDGMPFCPEVVTENSAYSVFRCAFAQAQESLWHPITDKERKSQGDMLASFAEARKSGVTKEGTATFLASADALGLQACRVKKDDDSYRLVYTKPGVKDYNGTFFMLRESKASKVIIMSPHDGTDGTHTDTKLAFQHSNALVMYSNGHPKGFGDFLDHANFAGAVATQQMDNLFPKSVWLMIHGQANPKSVLYRSRAKDLAQAFEKGIRDNTNIKIFHDNFNAYYVVDKMIDSNYYLKTEIPARIHTGNLNALAKTVVEIEKNNWAW